MTILKISYIDIIITYIIFNSLINDNLISKSPNFHKKCVFSKNLISKVFFFFPYLFKLNLLSICIYNKLFYHFNKECFFIIIIIRFNFFCSLLVFNILLLFVYYYYFRQTIHKSCNQPHFFFSFSIHSTILVPQIGFLDTTSISSLLLLLILFFSLHKVNIPTFPCFFFQSNLLVTPSDHSFFLLFFSLHHTHHHVHYFYYYNFSFLFTRHKVVPSLSSFFPLHF